MSAAAETVAPPNFAIDAIALVIAEYLATPKFSTVKIEPSTTLKNLSNLASLAKSCVLLPSLFNLFPIAFFILLKLSLGFVPKVSIIPIFLPAVCRPEKKDSFKFPTPNTSL